MPVELKKGELRKLEIIEATLKVLAEKGWLHTNYETVGQRCNMKRPHVAYHYPKWDELIHASLQFAYATGQTVVGDYLREAKTPRQMLTAYIEGTFHWLTAYPDHGAAITLLWHLATFEKKYRALSSELKRLGGERVYAILFGDEIQPNSARRQTAMAIHSLIVGRCVEFFSTELTIARDVFVQLTTEEALKRGGLK